MEMLLLAIGLANIVAVILVLINVNTVHKEGYIRYQSLVDLAKKHHSETDLRGLVKFIDQVKENRISYEKIRADEVKQIQKILNHLNSLEARTLIMHSIMEQNATLSTMKSKSIEEMETSQLLEIIEECTSTLRTKKP